MGEDKQVYEKCSVKCPGEDSLKKYGFGIRHVQIICMCGCMIALFIARSSLGVAILAMTDLSRSNDTNVERQFTLANEVRAYLMGNIGYWNRTLKLGASSSRLSLLFVFFMLLINFKIFEWDKNTQGLILSSFFWGYMVMQIPAGILAKKYGGKLILLVALLANGLIALILPTVARFGWPCVCVSRVVMGLTQACLFPASHTLLGQWLPARERTALSGIVYGGTQLGTIISMPVSGVLAETALGWKMIFYSISGLMFVTAAVWYWFTASSPAEHRLMSEAEREYIEMELNAIPSKVKSIRATPWKHMLTTVPLWAITMAHVGSTIAFTLFFVDLPTYLERAMEISLKNSAILSGMPYVGMWIGNIFASNICEKIFNRGLMSMIACRKLFNSIGLFGTACGLVVLAFLHPDHKNIAVCVLIGTLTLFGFIAAGFMVNHLDLSPQFAGVMLSLTNFTASLGSVLTPVATSLILKDDLSDISRWRIVFLLTASILVGCNIIYLILGSATRQPWDSPDYDDKLKANAEETTAALNKNQEKELEANRSSV